MKLWISMVGLVAVAGCSSAPPEPSADSQEQALCIYNAPDYAGPKPLYSPPGCAFIANGASRSFNSTAFEQGLANRGCSQPRKAGETQECRYVTPTQRVCVTRRWWGSYCPDTCSLQKHVYVYRDTPPIWARVSRASDLGACWPAPGAGETWTIWDPDCGSSCSYADWW